MPLRTPLCERLGIQVPIIQAPIGSAATPDLAAAVCDAGGLGMLALTWADRNAAREQIRQVRRRTSRPFGVNLVLDFPVRELLEVCLDEGVEIISTFWGDPASVTDRVRRAGALHLHSVGSVQEARQAVQAGVDCVVAQGWEAGGHVRGRTTTMTLVPAVVDAVGPVPVVAAGGIGDGRGLAAALLLGAQAGWLGTRFLTAAEAGTHPVYRHAVRTAGDADTVYTSCFDGGWPNAPHRVIRNSTVAAWEAAGMPAAPARPGEGEIVAADERGTTRLRYSDSVPVAGMTGDLEAMALYAGQTAALVHDEKPARQIVKTIAAQADRLLS
ncbi:NAD(P)H-dependent flavin oxidoreductase [Nonomuraea sp. CA-218870]|uniref:NAD(P)H-dependent flavin oxidoreductase n=1 Tax=Nonomuraea sp. CA-218870 TaxID=3239998 RepID=UPI003D8F8BB6